MRAVIGEVGSATALGAETEVGPEEVRLALQGARPMLGQVLEVPGLEQALEEVKRATEKIAAKERQEQS